MRILVTGARGKLGAATIHDLIEAGHDVTGTDLGPPVYEAGDSGAHYVQPTSRTPATPSPSCAGRTSSSAGQPLASLIEHHFGAEVSVGSLPREDAAGISSAKAERLLGYRPSRSWPD